MSIPPEPSSFEPPSPGLWSLDTAHFPRPATRFTIEVFAAPASRGFGQATARYGLLLDSIEWAFVHRWAYLCPRPVWSLGPDTPLTRERWDALVDSSPALRDRLDVSSRVFEDKAWREEVRAWDERIKPGMERDHRALQTVDPDALAADELWVYLDRCRENLRRAIYHHHTLNVAPVVPAGDFLVHATKWTGRPAAALVGLLQGDGPVSSGAAAELGRLAAALRADPAAAGLLDREDPTAVLSGLVARPGPVGQTASDYLDLTAHWSVGSGSDVGEPCRGELPGLLVETISQALSGGDEGGRAAAAEQAVTVRAEVPPADRVTFDELLGEARASHRVRDERATYCDVWAYGLARRAILAAGRRLAGPDGLEDPAHLVEAGHEEIRALLGDGTGPSGQELAARAAYRRDAREEAAPSVLGGPPPSPVPPEWLPAGAARTERAFRAYVGAMSEAEQPSAGEAVTGLPASPGTYEGPARLVRATAELDGIEKGDVLVTGSTTPAFNAVLPQVGAIVTDRGGLLSHAAIIAREYGIPAVVGTGEATRRIPAGSRVLVDGGAGQVTVVG